MGWLIAVLFMLWVVGFFAVYTVSEWVHVLLVAAIAMTIVGFFARQPRLP